MNLGYLALELRRVLREPGTLLFIIGFPGAFYLLEAVIFESQWPARSAIDPGAVLLPAMAGWGVLISGMLVGARVMNEREAGWQRQLRLTPLTGGGYLLGKAAVGLLVSIPPPIVVALAAALFRDVRLDLGGWLFVTLVITLGGTPFAVLGLLIGQFGNKKNTQQIIIIGMLVLAIFGGIFIPLDSLPPWFTYVGYATPSYWLIDLGRAGIEMGGDPMRAGLILLAWTVVLAGAVIWRYRHDSARN
ncbi:ABC transporter permease [Nonomuraea jiangxiensis]|uniref:ABC-2 type transport system permease protein n=1 Tax=Nonomuraea jiangxiensis TaxID=633440 RepID=A0A1G8TFU0_9ACTN|nr:ABC transporter permease [Nonomuraea jiangxiensis]SDJ40293.1 ABC-2 type transport system permease protein [Nonomuraea jiangxiensis]